MLRLPDGVTWTKVIAIAIVILAAVWASKQYADRQRLLRNLQAHAVSHPEDADIVAVLVGCHRGLVVDQEACGLKLIEQFGPERVMDRMEKLQAEGAFGRPVPTGEQPVQRAAPATSSAQ